MKVLVQSLALVGMLTACGAQVEAPFVSVDRQPISAAATANAIIALQSMLTDPDSLRITQTTTFASASGSFQIVCITFSARNSFNGMSPPNYFGATLVNETVQVARIETRFATVECANAVQKGKLYL